MTNSLYRIFPCILGVASAFFVPVINAITPPKIVACTCYNNNSRNKFFYFFTKILFELAFLTISRIQIGRGVHIFSPRLTSLPPYSL